MFSSIYERLCRLAALLGGDRSGHFGVATALFMLPLLAMVGAAVDLSRALSLREQLNHIADAAILDAVSDSALQDVYRSVAINADTLGKLRRKTEDNFFEMIPEKQREQMVLQASADINVSNGTITGSLSYRAQMQTFFMRILGMPHLSVTSVAQSTANMPYFTDVHILLDNSPSMLIAANAAEGQKLSRLVMDYEKKAGRTASGCFFACHDLDPTANARNYYGLARAAGIKLRYDVLKDALNQMLDMAQNGSVYTSQFQYSVYDFGDTLKIYFHEPAVKRVDRETNVAAVKAAISRLEQATVSNFDAVPKMGTPLFGAMVSLIQNMPTAGDGSTMSKRQLLYILLTDGVGNSIRPFDCTERTWADRNDQCVESIDLQICETMKRRGAKIAILNTVYEPMPDSTSYVQRVAPVLPTIQKNLEACATPGLYRSIQLGGSLDKELKSLFLQSLHTVRLTN